MRKVATLVIVMCCAAVGYLYYDWHVKTKKMAAQPSITLYSWTDAKGEKHFTDTQPPPGAENVEETNGYEYVEAPWVAKITEKAIDAYTRIKEKLFKKKEKRGK